MNGSISIGAHWSSLIRALHRVLQTRQRQVTHHDSPPSSPDTLNFALSSSSSLRFLSLSIRFCTVGVHGHGTEAGGAGGGVMQASSLGGRGGHIGGAAAAGAVSTDLHARGLVVKHDQVAAAHVEAGEVVDLGMGGGLVLVLVQVKEICDGVGRGRANCEVRTAFLAS